MTYTYSKKEGWVGFCDVCSMLFKPYVVDITLYRTVNHKRKHFKIEYIMKQKRMLGYCEKCVKKDGEFKLPLKPRLMVFVLDGVNVV